MASSESNENGYLHISLRELREGPAGSSLDGGGRTKGPLSFCQLPGWRIRGGRKLYKEEGNGRPRERGKGGKGGGIQAGQDRLRRYHQSSANSDFSALSFTQPLVHDCHVFSAVV